MTGKRALYRRKPCTKTPCSVLCLVGIYSGHKRMSADPAEQRIRELEKENAELKHANEILQEALGFFAQRRKK